MGVSGAIWGSPLRALGVVKAPWLLWAVLGMAGNGWSWTALQGTVSLAASRAVRRARRAAGGGDADGGGQTSRVASEWARWWATGQRAA